MLSQLIYTLTGIINIGEIKMEPKMNLPLSAVKRVVGVGGANRMSRVGAEAFVFALETYGKKIGEVASQYAQHAGRKTITEEDVAIAATELGFSFT